MILCGVMTGTSADSTDTAFVDFFEVDGRISYKLLAYHEFPFSEEIRTAIIDAMNDGLSIWDISQLNFALAELIAAAVKESALISGIDLKTVSAVGIHGQTLWHQPKKKDFHGIPTSSTFQLISLPAIGVKLGIPVIGDFRSADVALGGQGAPLVPIFDRDFYWHPSISRVMLNIGGIANVTHLPAGVNKDAVIAFDTGPGNVLIDIAMKNFYGKNFDDNGNTGRSGKLIRDMLESMMMLKYIRTTPPKSTGRDIFNIMLLNRYIPSGAPWVDIISTLTHYTAKSIAYNINKYCMPCDEVIVSGGGTQNSFLIYLLEEELPGVKIMSTDDIGLPSKAKESAAFAYLAYLRLAKRPGNLPSVTGAFREAILGAIY